MGFWLLPACSGDGEPAAAVAPEIRATTSATASKLHQLPAAIARKECQILGGTGRRTMIPSPSKEKGSALRIRTSSGGPAPLSQGAAAPAGGGEETARYAAGGRRASGPGW
uniref:Uncharacterized protein n=1 Tax=Arundo donax TaxID=35708 RepID=A0A0A9H3Q9_ARUDO